MNDKELKKELNQLRSWTSNLCRKIARFDEFKGLRGYPYYVLVEYFKELKKKDAVDG